MREALFVIVFVVLCLQVVALLCWWLSVRAERKRRGDSLKRFAGSMLDFHK